MKKLITILICMVIVGITYATDNKWKGGASGDWQDAGNWTGAHVPTVGENIVFDLGISIDCYNVPSVTLDNIFIKNAAHYVHTSVTLRGGTGNDGHALMFITSSTGQPSHTSDIDIAPGCTLNCNFTLQRVQIICEPGIRVLVESELDPDTQAFWVDGHFYPALYTPCEFETGLLLKSGVNYLGATAHAELVQQNHTDDVIVGWMEYTLLVNTWHEVSMPVFNDDAYKTPPALNLCRKSNCLCTFDGNYFRKFTNGDPAITGHGAWGDLMGNYTDCDVTVLNDEVGRGYEVFSLLPTNYIYGGFNNASYASPIGTTKFISLPMQSGELGWNFVGNPFPSGLKFTANSGSSIIGWVWNFTKIDPWVCYWDNNGTTNGSGIYRYYNVSTGDKVPSSTTDIIPRGQGFFVNVIDESFVPIKISNQARNFQTANQIGKSVTTSHENSFRLDLAGGTYNDEVLILMNNQNSTTGYDNGADFKKMFININERSEIFCKTSENIDVVVNSLKPSAGTVTVPVYMNVGPSGTYTLTASENTFSSNTGIILRDTKTNIAVDLKTTPSYTFTATVGDDPGRFILTFKDVLFGVNTLSTTDFGVYSFENTICVQNNTSKNINGTITVCDMLGRQLLQQNLGSDLITRINTNLNRGFYVVTVRAGDGVCSQKVYIK